MSILGESGLAGQLKKMLAKRMLAAELTHHLAYEDAASKNHRNRTTPKRVLAPGGELHLDIPRDCLSSFEPQLVPLSACSTSGLLWGRRSRQQARSINAGYPAPSAPAPVPANLCALNDRFPKF